MTNIAFNRSYTVKFSRDDRSVQELSGRFIPGNIDKVLKLEGFPLEQHPSNRVDFQTADGVVVSNIGCILSVREGDRVLWEKAEPTTAQSRLGSNPYNVDASLRQPHHPPRFLLDSNPYNVDASLRQPHHPPRFLVRFPQEPVVLAEAAIAAIETSATRLPDAIATRLPDPSATLLSDHAVIPLPEAAATLVQDVTLITSETPTHAFFSQAIPYLATSTALRNLFFGEERPFPNPLVVGGFKFELRKVGDEWNNIKVTNISTGKLSTIRLSRRQPNTFVVIWFSNMPYHMLDSGSGTTESQADAIIACLKSGIPEDDITFLEKSGLVSHYKLGKELAY